MPTNRLLLVLLSLVVISTLSATPSESANVYNGNHIFMCPAGEGCPANPPAPSLAQQGAIIEVCLDDANFDPIANYPWEDITWDDNGSGDLCMCRTDADADTDANGQTQFSGVPAGGGWTQGDINAFAAGAPFNYPGQQNVNSVDNTCDGEVDLADIGNFAIDFFAWGINQIYNFRSDFDFDGDVDLADVATMSEHIGHSCSMLP